MICQAQLSPGVLVSPLTPWTALCANITTLDQGSQPLEDVPKLLSRELACEPRKTTFSFSFPSWPHHAKPLPSLPPGAHTAAALRTVKVQSGTSPLGDLTLTVET